jgi:hypothetical protein
MYSIKSIVVVTLLVTGVLASASQAGDPPVVISGETARGVWDSLQANGCAQVVDQNIYDASGNFLGQYVKDVKTYNGVGTENGNPADGRVALAVTYDEPKWVPVTTFYPIYWWNATTRQWVYYQSYDQFNAAAAMNNLVATYGNIFNYGQAFQRMVYPQAQRATFGSPDSGGTDTGGSGHGLLGIDMGMADPVAPGN